jgi:hypothetical protein
MQVNCKEFARFYKRMLTINQKQRITPHEALEHPFFTPSETLKASALGEQTREKQRPAGCARKKRKAGEKEREDQAESAGLKAFQDKKEGAGM